ncbi:hypothetical protein [Dactylosporangium sp. NPDC000521]|uniref:hypothetical protein n=1 Tax=Dactylosporangium sp. NPDC000521 TaxID=3363975 RepID=UPI00368F792C
MTDVTESGITPEFISLCSELLGNDLLAYALSCRPDELDALGSSTLAPSQAQAEVANILSAIHSQIPEDVGVEDIERVFRGVLMDLDQENRPRIVRMHHYTSGQEVTFLADNDDMVEFNLRNLALDVYPAFLLPPDREFGSMPQTVNIHVSSLAHRHPASAAFLHAVMADPLLQRAFPTDTEYSGKTGYAYTNAGSAWSLQLLRFPNVLLERAWRQLAASERTPVAFSERAAEELKIARRLVQGRTSVVTLRHALAGVLLPPGTHATLDCGVLREATQQDWEVVPEHVKGMVETSTAAGETISIHYEGDIVLDYNFPLRMRIQEWDPDNLRGEFPPDLPYPSEVGSTLTRLRFSLVLAAPRDGRVLLLPAWQTIDLPLSSGSGIGFADLKSNPSILPTQLTQTEFDEWMTLYTKLGTKSAKRLELAFGRILRAMSERREPVDMLVDAVIAWENLFGTKEGEPTLRVTSSIAILLEQNFEARAKLRKRLTDIYNLRSDVVHGNRNLEYSEYPQCFEALDIAIKVLKVMILDRPDILDLPDGAQRSNRLILGN